MRKVLPYLLILSFATIFSCQRNPEYNIDEMAEASYDEDTAWLSDDDENIYPSEEMEFDEYAYGDKDNSERIKQYKTNTVNGTKISEKVWKEKIEGVSYIELEKPEVKEKEAKDFKSKDFNNNNEFFKILAYSIGIVGIGFVLFLLIRNYLKGKNLNNTSSIKDYNFKEISEEELKLLETENLIIQAENAGDYKSAFRLRYLQLLKKLLQLKWIRFKKDFTNRDYLSQLSQRKIVEPFAILTLYFDSYWYGEINIDKEKYLKSVPKFEQIEKDLEREVRK